MTTRDADWESLRPERVGVIMGPVCVHGGSPTQCDHSSTGGCCDVCGANQTLPFMTAGSPHEVIGAVRSSVKAFLTDCGHRIETPVGQWATLYVYSDMLPEARLKVSITWEDLDPKPEPKPCPGFAWIGQPITSCDNCGRPAWEHDYDQRIDRDAGPFAPDGWKYVPWDADLIDGWRRKGYITPERAMHLLALGIHNDQPEADGTGRPTGRPEDVS